MFLIKHLILFAVMACVLCGCGYTKLAFSKILTKFHPTPENVKTSAPEKCLLVTGNITGNIGKGVPVGVVAVTYLEKTAKIISYTFLPAAGRYYLLLPEGRYQLLVFADRNGNSVIEKKELIGHLRDLPSLEVEMGRAAKGKIMVEDISVDSEMPRSSEVPVSLDIPEDIKASVVSGYIPSGVITTLDDERFDEEYGFDGLYEPTAYFERLNGFLYLLEEYDPAKIPVVFVHGLGGTPKDWQAVVESLDRKRFQPLFFFYPTGLRIETIAEIFYDTFLSGKAVGTDRMVIAAHSQGGLVVREAMNLCDGKTWKNVPRLFVSICTPYGGVATAATAVAHSPVIVPSWIDLATASNFINGLHRRDLPKDMRFDLFFAYGNSRLLKLGPNGDQTVSLKSQLNQKAEKEADYIRGFNETHSEILRSREMIEEFNSILAENFSM